MHSAEDWECDQMRERLSTRIAADFAQALLDDVASAEKNARDSLE